MMPAQQGFRDISRRAFFRTAALGLAGGAGLTLLAACGDTRSSESRTAPVASGRAVTTYRQEGCSCCADYVEYLRANGFGVELKTVKDLGPIREQHGIPEAAVGCHTSVLGGYVVEGHVPVEAIERLLSERPALDGISVIGMPSNAPGMGQPNGEPLDILSFRTGRVADYMSVTTF